MGKILSFTGFLALMPIVLLLCISFYAFLTHQKNPTRPSFSLLPQEQPVVYAVLPSTENVFVQTVEAKDARVEIVEQFLTRYGSPLEPYANNLVSNADTYGLDYRLLPAIGMQESHLCVKAPKDSHNCWGFGIYGGKVKRFADYPSAIEVVTKTLAQEYKADGLDTPEKIMARYTPSSNGSWARAVNQFMDE